MGAIILTLYKALKIYGKKNVDIKIHTYQDGKNICLGTCNFINDELINNDTDIKLDDKIIMWEVPKNEMYVWI